MSRPITPPAEPSRMSAEVADAIREQAARQTTAILKDAMERHGERPEVLGVAAEGICAGLSLHVWRNRAAGLTPGKFRNLMMETMKRAAVMIARRFP